jgi:LCP family protein required for cell wall assembly
MKRYLFIILGILIFMVSGFLAWRAWGNPTTAQMSLNPLPAIAENDNMTQILLLGIGGGAHDGPNLTDTIIIASISQSRGDIRLLSVPRDLWIRHHDGESRKINAVYALGQMESTPSGILRSRSAVEEILGIPIHYVFRIDFDGFIQAVDLIGGITLTVPRSLDDYEYPITGKEADPCGKSQEEIEAFTYASTTSARVDPVAFFPCRYRHLSIPAGEQTMDGETALAYVRSRHAEGEEGSDFARSRRQQLVIDAFRSRVLSLGILTDPVKMFGLYRIVSESIDTDISPALLPTFLGLFDSARTYPIRTAGIDAGDGQRKGLVTDPGIRREFGYASVLIPSGGVYIYDEIRSFTACYLQTSSCIVPTSTQSER